jgi:hypothetical protein
MARCSVGRISEEDCRINTRELQTHTDMNDMSRNVAPVRHETRLLLEIKH